MKDAKRYEKNKYSTRMITVFLADDHAVLRDGLRYILETQQDITVIGDAADGRTAVQQVKQLHPDVVIMDIAMPDLNGIEATQHIYADCPATKVVILSIYATSEHIFRSLQAGARGYVLKESAGQEVVKAVRTVHTGRRYLSARITDTVLEDYLQKSRTAQTKSPLENLSQREREVLQLVVEGKSSADIAGMIHLSPKTVETYRSRIMQKLGIKDIPSLVKFALQHGLTSME
jgi:DNA-binding NarL/FixJ family response regulator